MGQCLKFQQIVNLLEQADSKSKYRSYLIVHPQREERRKLLEKLSQRFIELFQAERVFHEGKDWDYAYYDLAAPSLFEKEQVVIWEAPKGVQEETMEKIFRYMDNPSPWAFLLIGAESFKPFAKGYSRLDKKLAILDLSEEKPWDREKRQQQELLQIVKQEGKTIAPKALFQLMSISDDSLTLESELCKILSFIGEQSIISEKDVAAITTSTVSLNWQMAEEIVWEKGAGHVNIDLSSFLSLIGQMRFLLNQSRQIDFGLQEKKHPEEIMKAVNMRQTAFQKALQKMRGYKSGYFERALSKIYDIELLAKNSSLEPQFLFHYLIIQFAKLKKNYAR